MLSVSWLTRCRHEGLFTTFSACTGLHLTEPLQLESLLGLDRGNLGSHSAVSMDLCVGLSDVSGAFSDHSVCLHMSVALLQNCTRLFAKLIRNDTRDWSLGPQWTTVSVLFMRQVNWWVPDMLGPVLDVILGTFRTVSLSTWNETVTYLAFPCFESPFRPLIRSLTAALVAPSARTTLFSFLKSLISGCL